MVVEDSFRTAFEDVIVTSKICLKYPTYASSRSWYRYRQHALREVAPTSQYATNQRLEMLERLEDVFRCRPYPRVLMLFNEFLNALGHGAVAVTDLFHMFGQTLQVDHT